MQTDHLEEIIVPNEGHLVQGAPVLHLWSGIFPTKPVNPFLFLKTAVMWTKCKNIVFQKKFKSRLWLGETFVIGWIFEQWWGERVWEVQVSLREVPVMLSTQVSKCHTDKYLDTNTFWNVDKYILKFKEIYVLKFWHILTVMEVPVMLSTQAGSKLPNTTRTNI